MDDPLAITVSLPLAITDHLGAKSYVVDLPDDVLMVRLMPALASKMGLNPEGHFALQHRRTEHIIGSLETLRDAGVQPGDQLQLLASPTLAEPWLVVLNALRHYLYHHLRAEYPDHTFSFPLPEWEGRSDDCTAQIVIGVDGDLCRLTMSVTPLSISNRR